MAGSNTKALQSLYTDFTAPYGLSNSKVLYTAARSANVPTTRRDVEDFLAAQDSYTKHRRIVRKFPRNRVYVKCVDQQWQMDLVDMSSLSRYNDQYRFLLTGIDVLSKYAFAKPLKDKRGQTVTKALDDIIKETARKPATLQSDKGTEFLNSTFQTYLQKNGIMFFTTQNEDIKCCIVERFHRTLKNKMWRYFTERN